MLVKKNKRTENGGKEEKGKMWKKEKRSKGKNKIKQD